MQNLSSFVSDQRTLKTIAAKFGKENLSIEEMCTVRKYTTLSRCYKSSAKKARVFSFTIFSRILP